MTHLANSSLSGHESKGTRDLKALFPLIAGPVIVVSEGPFLVPDRPVACGVMCCNVMWREIKLCSMVLFDVVWCGVEWCGVVWCEMR